MIVCNINGDEKMLHFSLMGKHRNIEEYIRQTAAKEKQKIKESVLEGIYIIHNILSYDAICTCIGQLQNNNFEIWRWPTWILKFNINNMCMV